MKKLLLIPCILFTLIACDDDDNNNTVTENVAPTCKITAPANNATIVAGADLLITGTGSDKDGTINKATLIIGNKTIAAVTSVPFSYTLPATELKEGSLTIKLQVEDNQQATASDEIKVTIQAQSPVENKAPICKITAPATGSSIASTAQLTITGTGSDEDGTISTVALTIGGVAVAEVTAVPFSYTVPSAQMVAGTMQIQLTVTDNKQATATDAVTVTITAPAPDTNSMTDSRDSKTYRTVKMGTQIWMAENLAYLPQVNTIIEGSEVKESEEKPFYYVYGYDGNDVAAAKATKYYKDGVLYNWYAAIQGKGANAGNADLNPSGMQGICPEGWHLPSKDEWGQLYEWVSANIEDSIKKDFEGNEIKAKNVSGALRATTGWDPYSDSDMPDLAKGGLDLFGFCVKTYGGRDTKGFGFSGLGTMANYWATDYKSNSYGAQGGYVRFTRIDYDIAGGFIDANRGQSVRCVKN